MSSTEQTPPNEVHFKFFESLGSPKYGVAPMVDASELPFRMLCRKYGATIAWTPMFHSRLFVEQANYKEKHFSTCPEDRPLAVQFCANNPDTLLKAALSVQDECDAIDINLGCPQNIAKRGNYGAYLGEQWDIVKSLVEVLAQNLKIPVFVKIRILDSYERTIEYCKMIEAAGAALLTVHGRTKEMKGHNMGVADLELIREIKKSLSIPVFSNGNIRNYEEAQEALRITGCDGVMSACGLLTNPALFSGKEIPSYQLAAEYLDIFEQYPVGFHMARAHVFKLLNPLFRVHTDLRERMGTYKTIEGLREIVNELTERVKGNEDFAKEEIENAELHNQQRKEKRYEERIEEKENSSPDIDNLFK